MSDFLFHLLPRVYRELDEQGDRSLEALLTVIENQRQGLESDAAHRYDNWFIETCDDETIPAIAALLGLDHNLTRRASVANAIASRRRKGTFAALERAIADATGWTAKAHLETGNATFDAPGDATLHLTIWRQSAIAVTAATPFRLSPGRYTCNPMGIDVPLFHSPPANYHIERAATSELLPHRLSTGNRHPGTHSSLSIDWRSAAKGTLNGTLTQIPFAIADLSEWNKVHTRVGSAEPHALVDPGLGRFRLFNETALQASGGELQVSYAFAASADTGGGPYPRQPATNQAPAKPDWLAYVHHLAPKSNCPDYLFPTVQAALDAFRQVSCCGTIRILDSATYAFREIVIGAEFCGCGPLPDSRRTLTIDALSDQIPCLRGDLHLLPSAPGMNIVLSSLWIDGELKVGADLRLTIDRCTIRPDSPAPAAPVAAVAPHRRGIHAAHGEQPNLQLELNATICGPIRLPASCAGLTVTDSIVDSIQPSSEASSSDSVAPSPTANVLGPPTQLVRSTVLGKVDSCRLQNTDSIVAGDGPEATAIFLSARYGDPDFARLRDDNPLAPLDSASNGSEMGAFNLCDQPKRLAQLKAVLADFVPEGMTHVLRFES